MDPRERAWAELALIDRFATTEQPREALARVRRLEHELQRARGLDLEPLRSAATARRRQLEEDVERWDAAVRARHAAFQAHEHEHNAIRPRVKRRP